MRIQSIFSQIPIARYENNRYDCSQYRVPVLAPLLKPLPCDTVSFGRTAENAETLRALMAYGIPDMYSGKNVIDPKILERFYSKHVFSRAIKNVIKIMKPFEKSLHDIEREFLSIVKTIAKTNPEFKLADVIRKIAPEHNKKLLEIQQPIFDDLTEMSKEMPLHLQQEFNSMMSTIYKKLKHEPVVLPFSAKEFQYKLQRIADEIAEKNNPSEISTLRRILQTGKKLPEKTPQEENNAKNIKSKAKRNKKIKNDKNLIRKRADILTQIEIMAAETNLKNNQELTKLFARTRSKIYSIPIVIPFNRKSFIYELQKITNKLEDTKLAHKMVQKAVSLPTSHDNLSAFVMKCVEYSSDKIGYNMVAGSAGSIDHLIPFVKNGKDNLQNYGISSAYYNSERAQRPMQQQLKKYPQTYENCQKQVDRLIELYNDGTFKKIGLPKHYITNFVRRMYNLSPEDNRLILNIDKLKQ